MTTIATHVPVLTLINVFTVAPEKQQTLIDLLDRATEETMRHQPGFLSANLHRSLDGKRVINYAQWRDRASFEAMRLRPEVRVHMEQAAALAEFDPILCEVAVVHDQQGGQRLRASQS